MYLLQADFNNKSIKIWFLSKYILLTSCLNSESIDLHTEETLSKLYPKKI
jgi:hypothetical protein